MFKKELDLLAANIHADTFRMHSPTEQAAPTEIDNAAIAKRALDSPRRSAPHQHWQDSSQNWSG